MRMTEDMGSQRVKCLAVIALFLLILLVTCAESWGQCTPGQRAWNDTYEMYTMYGGDKVPLGANAMLGVTGTPWNCQTGYVELDLSGDPVDTTL
jgi:hypothetical protein